MARIPDEYWNDIQVPLQELALVARKVDEYAKQHGEDESREYGFRLLWEARSSVETVLRCLVVVQAALKVNSAERQDRDRKRRFGITGLADDTFTHMTDASSVKKYHPELSTGNDFVTRQYFRVLRRHVWEALDERLLASKSARKQINWIRRKSVYVKRVWLDRIPGTNVTKAISERFDCEVRRIRSDLKIIREFEQAATISLFGMRLDRIKPKAMDLSGVFDDIMTWSVIEGELIEPQVLILRFAPDSNLPFLQRDRLAVIKDRFSNPAELLKRAKTKFQNRFNYEVNWRELDKWRKSKMPR